MKPFLLFTAVYSIKSKEYMQISASMWHWWFLDFCSITTSWMDQHTHSPVSQQLNQDGPHVELIHRIEHIGVPPYQAIIKDTVTTLSVVSKGTHRQKLALTHLPFVSQVVSVYSFHLHVIKVDNVKHKNMQAYGPLCLWKYAIIKTGQETVINFSYQLTKYVFYCSVGSQLL